MEQFRAFRAQFLILFCCFPLETPRWGRHSAVITATHAYTWDLAPMPHGGKLDTPLIRSLFAHLDTSVSSPFHAYIVSMPPQAEVMQTKAQGVSSYQGLASSDKWKPLKEAVLVLQKEESAFSWTCRGPF